MHANGKLILVPTPIGNLKDITFRAIEVLGEVDLILAEDTRVTKKLLQHFNIVTRMESLHQNNEHIRVPKLVEQLWSGAKMAYCSDAGTPGISDPGYLFVKACIERHVAVECLPGATAFVPALVASGLPSERFVFEGFLPHKKGRQKRWEMMKTESRTIVLYESTHRIFKLLEEIRTHMGNDRNICVARELTKLHETLYRGTVEEVTQQLKDDVNKGEFVVVISGEQ